ncbi:MAG TPA: MFS transporter [Alphaproteobacteria bacterium]|nr:MFS transporter [Alphaproteobacteria bacterium]
MSGVSESEAAGRRLWRSRWWIVAAATSGMIVGQGPITIFAFGVFLKPVTEALGVSRGTLSSTVGLLTFVAALVTPLMGRMIDRFGVRAVLLPIIGLFALATMALARLQASLPLLYLLVGLQGLFSAGQTPTGYVKAISAWFDRKRGLALGIAQAGVGLGVAAVPQLAAYLIRVQGWRAAYVGLGVAILVFAFLPVALLIREPPTPRAPASGPATLLPGVPAGAAWRTRVFWILNGSFLLAVMAINGTLAHAVAVLTDRGLPLQEATGALSLAGLALIGGRVLAGYCLDRWHGRYVALGFFCCPLLGIALLASAAPAGILLLGTALCGIGVGAEIDLMAFLIGRYFGLRAYATIYGLIFAIFTIGTGLGPYLMGVAFDRYHSYRPMFAIFEAALVLACLLVLRLGPYAYPAPPARLRAGIEARPRLLD